MKKLIVFLDIDGVIATKRALDLRWKEYLGEAWSSEATKTLEKHDMRWPASSMDDWPFDMECTKNIHVFQRSLPDTKVEFVISSSWRMGRTVEMLDGIFAHKGLLLSNIVGKTDCLWSNKKPSGRGVEILTWLIDNNEEDTPFLVFDDECGFDIDSHIDNKHLINTPFSTGFNDEKFSEAIEKARVLIYKK